MSKKKNRKGFSVGEVVIALSIIVIVSLSALSVVLTSIIKSVDTKNTSNAQLFADNVWECFKAADGEAEFLRFVNFAERVELTGGVIGANSFKTYRYNSEDEKFTALISVRYSGRSELEISVIDDDNKEIISFSYRKGDGI